MTVLDTPLDAPARDDAGADLGALVAAARRGEARAWECLVQRFTPLVRAVTARFRLGEHDAEDVAQVVWLRLVEHLDRLREPLALPGWIATTARCESLRVARAGERTLPVDPLDDATRAFAGPDPELDADLLQAEQVEAVRQGLAGLSSTQRDLLLLLVADPPLSYREISARLGMPVGSIGPTRARTLARLEATPAVSRYLATDRVQATRPACAA